MSLHELLQQVHMARAQGLHGEYEEAKASYKLILDLLQRHQKLETKPQEQAKWQSCIDDVITELQQVVKYDEEKRDFRRSTPSMPSTSHDSAEHVSAPAPSAKPSADAHNTFANGLRAEKPRRVRNPPNSHQNVWKTPSRPPASKPYSRDHSGVPPKPPVPKQARGKSHSGVGPPGYDACGDDDLVQRLMGEVLDGSPGVRWDDIAGLQDAKLILREALELPQLAPDLFTGIRTPVRGVLLHGPPGTGKTLLAKAVATECNTTFFNISSSSLASKWKGDSEKLVRHLFGLARHYAPSTVFIDEMDSVCSKNEGSNEASLKVKTELLTQINGIQKGDNVPPPDKRVLLVGATNNPQALDDAFIRRLEKRVYIPLPELPDRAELLRINCRGTDIAEDVDLMEIAAKLEGYSGDDIRGLCREAAMIGLRRRMEGLTNDELKALNEEFKAGRLKEPIRNGDFYEACQRIRPSVREADLAKHLKFQEDYRSV